jgi:hypothetical protein
MDINGVPGFKGDFEIVVLEKLKKPCETIHIAPALWCCLELKGNLMDKASRRPT